MEMEKMQNNSILLNCDFRQPLATTLNFVESKSLPGHLQGNEQKKTNLGFKEILLDYFDLLLLHHWGVKPSDSTQKIANAANSLISEYYSTDWYSYDKYEAREMHKSADNEEFEDAWYKFYRTAFLIALLSKNNDNLKLMSNWAESWFVPSSMLPINPTWARIMVFVGASFRTLPLEGQGKLQELIENDSDAGARELFEAWKWVLKKNNDGFKIEFSKSLETFEGSLSKKPGSIEEPIAVFHSIVFAAARLLGTDPPNLKPQRLARLVTPESVGLI